MSLLDSHEQVDRNRRKFFMKYGFDVIQYVDMMAAGNTDDELVAKLGISSQQLDHFRNGRKNFNLKQYYNQN